MTGSGTTQTVQNLTHTEYGSLTAARGWIGEKQSSETCTRTQDSVNSVSFVSVTPQMTYCMDMMIMASLTNALYEASWMFTTTIAKGIKVTQKMRDNQAKQAIAFISGTGLDVMLKEYGIDYDPDELREQFFYRFGYRKTI